VTLKGIYKLIFHPKQFMKDYKKKYKTLKKDSSLSKGVTIMNIINSWGINIKVFGLDFRGTEVVIYFYGSISNFYQIEQWLPIFEQLNKKYKVVFIFRNEAVYKYFISKYHYQSVFLNTLNDLNTFYKKNNFKVVLYVNNGVKNFQSLMCNKMFHIHINHGESEKESMHSNQAKAYDYVFVVGDKAIDRYKNYLINFDESKFIKVGRPQLDFIEPINLEKSIKKIILYAPTWEATHDSMNYSSIDKFGVKLIEMLIDEKYTIIYKPHPAVGTKKPKVKKEHEKIVSLLKEYEYGYIYDENINNIFPIVDFAFFDNSSVMIDYLHFDKPAGYIKIQDDEALKILEESYLKIDNDNLVRVVYNLEEIINKDNLKHKRRMIKKYYLGDSKSKKSTDQFIEVIGKIIKAHKLISNKKWKENE
jgi:CDP-glycerol glycerophosphotransferase (TagB/SpsB family)